MGTPHRRRVTKARGVLRAGLLAALLAALLTGMGGLAATPAAGQAPPGAPGHVSVHGAGSLRTLGQALATDAVVWRPFPGIGTLADIGVDSLEIWLAADLGARDVPRGLRHPETWVAGTAEPSLRRIALRTGPGLAGPGGLRSVLRHELAHLALAEATGGNYPRWLTEGYAQYASGEWSWGEAWQLQTAFLRRGAASLAGIDLRFRRHPTDARLGYLLSYTAVHEIADLGGEAGLQALFRRLGEGEAFDAAFWKTFGITVEVFEARWKRSLVDRYGWLYLMSRAGVFWGGVTLLVLIVAVRRMRHDRRRLAELRAAEETGKPAIQGASTNGPHGPD